MKTSPILVVAAVLSAAAASAAVVPSRSGSSTVPADSGEKQAVLDIGSGWILAGGYFYKDRIFGNHGSGGPIVSVGRTFALPYRFGLWTGAGGFRARGHFDVSAEDGSRYRAVFDENMVYVELGIQTPWVPFPLCLALYRQGTDLDLLGLTGPLTGSTLAGRKESFGEGFAIHLLLEYFFSKKERPPRGLGLVGGYSGFIDGRGVDIRAADVSGDSIVMKGWKPFRGESLRLGLEYEF